MMKRVYDGTEMGIDGVLDYFKNNGIPFEKICTYSKPGDGKEVSRDVYLVDDVVMEVVISPGYSAMSVNDSATASLVGLEERVHRMERTIKESGA